MEELHSEDDRTHSEKGKKRKIKTPAQIEGLEKFYDEHKYPTEAMKLQLAESLGLTEKQVSGWFCHRRLKDKRLMNGQLHSGGKVDRSSGVIIQDRGSGLRQDSCGSTKQGDDRNYELKEVESRRYAGEAFSIADPTNERDSHHTGKSRSLKDTSSESSSPLRNAYVPPNWETSEKATSRNSVDVMSTRAKTGPSGYLKIKGHVENAAITAVKRQLGRLYREDGPPLGVDFEPLPPGAFESQGKDFVSGPRHVEETLLARSPGVSKILKQTNFSTRVRQRSNLHEDFPLKTSSSDMPEHSLRDIPTQDWRNSHRMRAKHSAGGLQMATASSYHPYPNEEQGDPYLHGYHGVSNRVSHGEHFELKPSNFVPKDREYYNMEQREQYKRMRKCGKVSADRRAIKEEYTEDKLKVSSNSETRAFTRERFELPRQHCLKVSPGEMPPSISAATRFAADMPSSISDDDDETAQTSSEDGLTDD